PPAVYSELQSLLRRRAVMVASRTSMLQSWTNEKSMRKAFDGVLKEMAKVDLLLRKRIKDLLREADLLEQVERCQAIEGIGFLRSARCRRF
ncbi:IS110 family transposase, partial [Pseudomonas putida]|nr:IS110 family transposase [Pseudomonas putida]